MIPLSQEPIRHYVHGDAREGDPYTFFCASCDLFVAPSHFSDERHSSNLVAKYEQSLKNWRSKSSNYPGKYRRPKDAENWLTDMAMAEKRKATAARSKFFAWLSKQSDRADPTGDLSKDCLRDDGFPVSLTAPERLRWHLRHRRACDEALVALDEALEEFKSSPKARVGLSLAIRFQIFRDDDYRCQLCGGTAQDGKKLEVDHKTAVARGGTNARENLWTLCFECNRGKRTREV
jgi:HNH endonuclease/YozE SAM-like fold